MLKPMQHACYSCLHMVKLKYYWFTLAASVMLAMAMTCCWGDILQQPLTKGRHAANQKTIWISQHQHLQTEHSTIKTIRSSLV